MPTVAAGHSQHALLLPRRLSPILLVMHQSLDGGLERPRRSRQHSPHASRRSLAVSAAKNSALESVRFKWL